MLRQLRSHGLCAGCKGLVVEHSPVSTFSSSSRLKLWIDFYDHIYRRVVNMLSNHARRAGRPPMISVIGHLQSEKGVMLTMSAIPRVTMSITMQLLSPTTVKDKTRLRAMVLGAVSQSRGSSRGAVIKDTSADTSSQNFRTIISQASTIVK